MNNGTLASGGGGALAVAVVTIISYALSLWHIILPSDVTGALTALVYFFGHRILSAKLTPTPPSS